MKEVTYEEWIKNPTPRMMWVWNDDIEEREEKKVVYVIKDAFALYPVLTVSEEDSSFCTYCRCAEIEEPEPKTRRMTNKELSRWLSEKPHRERKYGRGPYIYTYHTYAEYEQDEEVPNSILIREDDGAWHLPIVEVKE